MGWEDAALLFLEAFGGYLDFNAAEQTGEYRQQVYNENAAELDQAAEEALIAGERDVSTHRLNVRRLIGRQKASIAAQGIEVNERDSSARGLIETTEFLGELDTSTIRSNAMNKAKAYAKDARNQRASGELARVTGRNEAFGTLLTTGSNAVRILGT